MFRIDDPTAAAALPAPEAAGTPGYFTEGSPGAVTPTLVRASFLNMLQEEFVAVCAAAGIALSKTTYNQLLTALRSAGVFQTAAPGDNTTKAATTAFVQALFTQFTGARSMAANGYRVLPAYPGDPTPLILQWLGSTTHATAGTGAVHTFPLAFPNNNFGVLITPYIQTVASANPYTVSAVSPGLANFSSQASAASIGFKALAIGN